MTIKSKQKINVIDDSTLFWKYTLLFGWPTYLAFYEENISASMLTHYVHLDTIWEKTFHHIGGSTCILLITMAVNIYFQFLVLNWTVECYKLHKSFAGLGSYPAILISGTFFFVTKTEFDSWFIKTTSHVADDYVLLLLNCCWHYDSLRGRDSWSGLSS